MPETLRIEEDDVQELFHERGWTDGLPIVAPTPARVDAMLAATDRDRDELLGAVPQRGRSVAVHEAAVCAVMAGCPAACFPVVLTATEALLDPAVNPHAVLSSTGGAGIAVVVSGPLADEIGMNARHGVLGPGNRPNATIGRALRLLAITVLDARPGRMDASSIGHPGKYTLCFAEDPPPEPWEPLRVALGYAAEDTTVTVIATEGPRQIANQLNPDGFGVLRTFAAGLGSPATFIAGIGGQALLVLGPEHARALVESGISREAAAELLVRETRIAPEALVAGGIVRESGTQHDVPVDADGLLPTLTEPADVLLVTAGAGGAGWSALLPSFAPRLHTRAVTRRIRPRGEALPDCGPDACVIALPPVD